MANLLSLKRRIKTAQNVSKTTKAFQMIAASKLKKAEEAALSSRPYVEGLTSIATNIYSKIDPDDLTSYMKKPEGINKKLLIIVTPDKGLCGGLVSNIGRAVNNFYKENKDTIFITFGKKGSGQVKLIGGEITAAFDFGLTIPEYSTIYPLMSLIDEYFLGNKVSEVFIATTFYNSIFSQSPVIKKLLPFELNDVDSKKPQSLFEPSAKELLPGLIRHYIEMSIYQSILESYLSEQSARMLAMQNATDNANEIIEELRLMYNKSRQEKITNEILDIAGGVFAYA